MHWSGTRRSHGSPETGTGKGGRGIFCWLTRNADRIGVWMETHETPGSASAAGSLDFRGMVADRMVSATPAEWARLSPEAPLLWSC